MSTVRVRMRRWGTRNRSGAWRLDVRSSLLLLACVVVVFGAFFAIGRLARSTPSSSTGYGPQKLPAVYVSAGIPYGFPTAPAIPSLAAFEAPAAAAPASPTPAVHGSSSSSGVEASQTPRRESAPVESVAPTPTRAPAPVQSAPAPAAPSHGGGSSSGGGGSFDSSG
jgi:hypothetical protein